MMNLNIIKMMEMYLRHRNVYNNGSQLLGNNHVYQQSLEDAQNAAINEKEIRNIYVILFLVAFRFIHIYPMKTAPRAFFVN